MGIVVCNGNGFLKRIAVESIGNGYEVKASFGPVEESLILEPVDAESIKDILISSGLICWLVTVYA